MSLSGTRATPRIEAKALLQIKPYVFLLSLGEPCKTSETGQNNYQSCIFWGFLLILLVTLL